MEAWRWPDGRLLSERERQFLAEQDETCSLTVDAQGVVGGRVFPVEESPVHPTLLAWQQQSGDVLDAPTVPAAEQDAQWPELSALAHTTLSQIAEAAQLQVQSPFAQPSQRVQPLPLGRLTQEHFTEQRFLIATAAVAASIVSKLSE